MSSTRRPRAAMVLAAGLGKRLRPITDTCPKPLVEIGGLTMLDRALNMLADSDIKLAVVNTHHLAEQIEKHVQSRKSPEIKISREDRLLETGGGVAAALEKLGEEPFFVLNSDVVILDGPTPALERLIRVWDESRMDALLLLQRTFSAYGYDGMGDFALDQDGKIRRRKEREVVPYLFAGIQIIHPKLFKSCPTGPFSMNLLFDQAIERERLFGLVHDGSWLHIGDVKALKGADKYLMQTF